MDKVDLSILIPARNEEFLGRTIQDILEHTSDKTEIIAVLDGYLPDPPLPVSSRVTVIYNPVSVGQRAGANQAARLSNAKYLIKLDAHCAISENFDTEMIAAMEMLGDDTTLIPVMRNMHVFDWVCEEGHRRYQSPSGVCETCGKPTVKDIVWIPKKSPTTHSFRFDKTMHFQYGSEWSKNSEIQKGTLMGYRLSFDTRSITLNVINLLADFARSHKLVCLSNDSWFRQNVSSDAMCFPSIDSGGSVGASEVLGIGDKFQVEGITAASIVTKMVNNGDMSTSTSGNGTNEPSIDESVCECFFLEEGANAITTFVFPGSPIPTARNIINCDFAKKLSNELGGDFVYSEKTNTFHNGSVILIPEYVKDFRETMSIQGSCFMLSRERYFALNICSEEFHSWGQQGVEVACKTWLSGGRVVVNMKTWYAHMFRTRGGDFGFPYSNPQAKVNENRELSRELFQRDKWPLAIHKFQWLLDKFNPPDWGVSSGIIFYTPNDLNEKIAKPVRDRLLKISQDKKIDIVSSSLKRMDFGVKNVRFPSLKKGYLTMAKQILGALENSKADIVFFTEHDVYYSDTHFDFVPEKKDVFYFNNNVWKVDLATGRAVKVDKCEQLSGMCVYRETALKWIREKYKQIEENGFDGHFEPQGVERGAWESKQSNIDIRHDSNLTPSRWSKEQFRNQDNTKGWTESENWAIPGWNPQDLIKSLQ